MVTSISSQKGGVGKTTTSISLASGLARRGRKVLLIDTDPQANSSKVLVDNYPAITKEQSLYSTIINRQELNIVKSKVQNLDIVPSHILVSETDMQLALAKDNRAMRLKSHIDNTKGEYDYVFIDTPPALSWLTINSFVASDEIIITISPGYFELDSIDQILTTIAEVQSEYNQNLKVRGFVFTMKTPNLESVESYKLLKKYYGDFLLHTHIPRNNDMAKAFMMKKDIFDFAPYSPAGLSYGTLIDELYFSN